MDQRERVAIMSDHAAGDTSPTVLVAVDRGLVEALLTPEAVAEAERASLGFEDDGERRAWLAGRLGALLGWSSA